MFIELTDHLRCPRDHEQSFLVLVPDEMRGRQVVRGRLGCPVCQAEFPIVNGIAEFGGQREARAPEPIRAGDPDPAAILAFLGIEGPGGYVALLGDAARFAVPLMDLLPGVHFVAVNPPSDSAPSERLSILRAPRLPLGRRAFRGVVVGRPEALDPTWRREALEALLPGLRAVGTGAVPEAAGFELLGQAGGWWVGRRTTG
jgi:uncharacterized protein YbaR (Trm112 family)